MAGGAVGKWFGDRLIRVKKQNQPKSIRQVFVIGVPVFVGTRVPLQTFFDYLEGESGLAEFLEDFPHLKTPALQVLEAIAKAMLNQERTATAHSA